MRIPSGLREKRTPLPDRVPAQGYSKPYSLIATRQVFKLDCANITVGETLVIPSVPEGHKAHTARMARAARDASKVQPHHYHVVRYQRGAAGTSYTVQQSISITLADAEAQANLYRQTEGRAYATRFLTPADTDTLVDVRITGCHHEKLHTERFGRKGRLERLVCSK